MSVYSDNKLHHKDDNDAWTKLYDLVPVGVKVLDVGCSSGNFGAELIGKKKCTVVGIDIDKDDVELSKKRLTESHLLNIESDDLSIVGKFDVIVMADVIEHLIDPAKALKKLGKHLNPDGKLIFSVPNMANFANRIELLKGRFEYTEYGLLDQTHLHYYDRVQLEAVLADGGFEVEYYNNTIRDIPKRVLAKELGLMGLSVSDDTFWKLASHIDSITFQFIGVARASSNVRHAAVISKTPYDFVSRQIDLHKSKHELELIEAIEGKFDKLLNPSQKEVLELKKALEQRAGAIRHLEGLIEEKTLELANLKHRRGSFVRRVIERFTRR
ncbi:class I SAM-dependent methyltransferase [Candidatus Saccharibacteria bacterium]|nr:class I SAM-dependent methyltransferase [Candidatus Saccharibacteria bacterium]MCA9313408.1 class I SAM-dependent methyltransferase [Candidatus Saccharibacteria bacterium]